MFTLLSSFCIWTKHLTYISQLTSNNITSCCKSHSELFPLKTATAETSWELLYRFYQCFPIIHCATILYIMENLNFDYSQKNIRIPDETSQLIKLLEKVQIVIKRMHWKALFFLDDGKDKSDDQPKFFFFKTRKILPSCTEMESFQKDLLNRIPSVKFKTIINNFQLKLKDDVNQIRKPKNMFVFADEIQNLYTQKIRRTTFVHIQHAVYLIHTKVNLEKNK